VGIQESRGDLDRIVRTVEQVTCLHMHFAPVLSNFEIDHGRQLRLTPGVSAKCSFDSLQASGRIEQCADFRFSQKQCLLADHPG